MKEEIKAYLRELYKRQENEYRQLANLRLKLFEKGEYQFVYELQNLESLLSDFNNKIATYFQDEYLSHAEHRAEMRRNPSLYHDNVD